MHKSIKYLLPTNMNRFSLLRAALLFLVVSLFSFKPQNATTDDAFVTYELNPQKADIKLYWKDANGQPYKTIDNVKKTVESNGQLLVFAMNGGMYKADNSPQGLYVENKQTLSPLDTADGSGNFYLKPNGVFYITTGNVAGICTTADYRNNGNIKFATQSGPLLLIDGKIHPVFNEKSANLNIRNGVGILPGNRVVFVMSKTPVNFYSFASYFKNLGCKNALYLDGFVSRTYLPDKNRVQTDGNFGVIIGVTKPAK